MLSFCRTGSSTCNGRPSYLWLLSLPFPCPAAAAAGGARRFGASLPAAVSLGGARRGTQALPRRSARRPFELALTRRCSRKAAEVLRGSFEARAASAAGLGTRAATMLRRAEAGCLLGMPSVLQAASPRGSSEERSARKARSGRLEGSESNLCKTAAKTASSSSRGRQRRENKKETPKLRA